MKKSIDCVGQYLLPFGRRIDRAREEAITRLVQQMAPNHVRTIPICPSRLHLDYLPEEIQQGRLGFIIENPGEMSDILRMRLSLERQDWAYPNPDDPLTGQYSCIAIYLEDRSRTLYIYEPPITDVYAPEIVEPPLRRNRSGVQRGYIHPVVNRVRSPRVVDAREENGQVGVQHDRSGWSERDTRRLERFYAAQSRNGESDDSPR